MSAKAPGAEHRSGPRCRAALLATLGLLACSGTEPGADDASSGGSPTSLGGAGGGGGSGSAGLGAGTAAGGATTGGAAPSDGRASSSGADGGGGSAGSSGAPPLGGAGGSPDVASGGVAPNSGRGPNGGDGSGGSRATGGRTNAGGAGANAGGGGANAGGGGANSGGTSGGSGGSSSSCPLKGSVTYTLMRAASPTAEQAAAYDRITAALDKALGYYNCYTDIAKQLRASYEPSIATADGNVNGAIRFGSQDSMNYITAMHEIGHTVGVGSNEWGRMIRDGIFTGETATRKLREIDQDPAAQVHGDAQHFWPYGLNYTTEVKSDADLLAHCAMVMAIRADLYP